MKISRNDLKILIKECLVELLRDGLGSELGTATKTANVRMPFTENAQRQQNRNLASSHAQSSAKKHNRAVVTPMISEAIKRQSGGDPIMAGIFEDTARTTLPLMIQSDMPGHVASAAAGDTAARIVASNSPEQIFGEETTDRWAHLAFAAARPGLKSQLESQLNEQQDT